MKQKIMKKSLFVVLACVVVFSTFAGFLNPAPASAAVFNKAVKAYIGGQDSAFFILREDGTVLSWGQSDLLGRPLTEEDSGIPTLIPGLTGVKDLHCSDQVIFAEMLDGTYKSWGYTGAGRESEFEVPATVPQLGVNQVKKLHFIKDGPNYAEMIDGSIMSWGNSNLGYDTGYQSQATPKTIQTLGNQVETLYPGFFATFAKMKDGRILSWGSDSLGYDATPYRYQITPREVPALGVNQVDHIYNNDSSVVIAKMKDGSFKSWGNHYGNGGEHIYQLIPETITALGYNEVAELRVETTNPFQVAFATMKDGTFKSWGTTHLRLLGYEFDGYTSYIESPTTVTDLGVNQVKKLYFPEAIPGSTRKSAKPAFAEMIDGTFVAWGNRSYGQLGVGNSDGIYSPQFKPIAVPSLGTNQVENIIQCGRATIAQMKDGSFMGTGDNSYGTLGLPQVEDDDGQYRIHSFVKLPGLSATEIAQLVAPLKYDTNLAILFVMKDGTVKEMGSSNPNGSMMLEEIYGPDKAPTLTGADAITIKTNSTFDYLQGVTATDLEDGDLTSSISYSGTVNTNIPGLYPVNYSVTDKADNVTTVTRNIRVANAPVITGHGARTISTVVAFDPMFNISATDTNDGAITDKIVMVNTLDQSKPGIYKITYTVTNSFGLSTTVEREITVIDTVRPTISGTANKSVKVGSAYDPKAGVTVSDNVDGNITDKLVVTYPANFSLNTVGTYVITFSATDAAGNTTTVQRTLNVIK